MIFVFGSNLAGRHGKGAALVARHQYGAVYGVGVGRTGNAYAIPTKDENLKTLHWDDIEGYWFGFIEYTYEHPEEVFLVTPFGTGLAKAASKGYWRKMVCRYDLPDNIVFHKECLK